jgi:hypothetical protein
MAELDEVLERIDDQLNKMKKSLRSSNRELVKATISSSGAQKPEQHGEKNLHGTPAEKPAARRPAVENHPQR